MDLPLPRVLTVLLLGAGEKHLHVPFMKSQLKRSHLASLNVKSTTQISMAATKVVAHNVLDTTLLLLKHCNLLILLKVQPLGCIFFYNNFVNTIE